MFNVNTFLHGDNIAHLQSCPDNSVDSIVTDAPYGLGKEPDPVKVMAVWCTDGYYQPTGKGFMGKQWDAFVPQPAFWKECFRVLKPGGHVLCFFGTRTYDWGVMAMRFAGFEIRDCLQWIYGSGFPKSLDISKAIDKEAGAERDVVGKKIDISTGKPMTAKQAKAGNGKNINDGWDRPWRSDDNHCEEMTNITAPATEAAKQYHGYGTALKPAVEPIVLARKPISEKTIAANVLKWGTGGLWIDGCRVGLQEGESVQVGFSDSKRNGINDINEGWQRPWQNDKEYHADKIDASVDKTNNLGRFPANILLDEEAAAELDKQSGTLTSGAKNGFYNSWGENGILGTGLPYEQHTDASSVGASRFFKVVENGLQFDFFTYIYSSINELCGYTLEGQKVAGITSGVFLEIEKFIQGAELYISGSNKMGHSLQDTKYTTEILINQMTTLKTCNVLRGMNIEWYMQELTRIISLFQELNTENASNAANINHLTSFLLEMLEHIKAIARVAQNQNCSNGGKIIGNGIISTTESAGVNRFFYTAKASKSEHEQGVRWMSKSRGGSYQFREDGSLAVKATGQRANIHPTVKPLDLMQYLVRLITPKGGICLDPFSGSGTTCIAAKMEGLQWIGIEQDADYVEIAENRIKSYAYQIPLL